MTPRPLPTRRPPQARGAAPLVTALCALAFTGCAAAPPPPAEALPAEVSFALETLEREPLDLAPTLAAGTPVAFVFWQEWCPPCAQEAPHVVEAVAAHGDDLRFVGVVPGADADVDEAKVRAKRDAWCYTFPQIRDRDESLTQALGVTATPTLVVVTPDRRVVYREHALPRDWAGLIARATAPQE